LAEFAQIAVPDQHGHGRSDRGSVDTWNLATWAADVKNLADADHKEAADILNISRPFLVKLLDRGEIPYHRVGTHRRLNVEDALGYRELRAKRRREKLRELTELSEQVEGGYR
jgi:excisionase family DNA binding protein